MTVTVIGHVGSTRVAVTGGLAKKGTIVTGGQLVSSGEKGALTRRFLEALDRALNETLETESSRAASGDDATTELERLADLHGRGVLTDEEFAAAKSKMIERM